MFIYKKQSELVIGRKIFISNFSLEECLTRLNNLYTPYDPYLYRRGYQPFKRNITALNKAGNEKYLFFLQRISKGQHEDVFEDLRPLAEVTVQSQLSNLTLVEMVIKIRFPDMKVYFDHFLPLIARLLFDFVFLVFLLAIGMTSNIVIGVILAAIAIARSLPMQWWWQGRQLLKIINQTLIIEQDHLKKLERF